jgi:branched-chain amino acid transport system permease protein
VEWVYSNLQVILDGLMTGSLYALIGMGMALIFGVMRIVTFAHGAFLMMGMYVTFVLFDHFHLSPYIGFLVAGGVLFVFGSLTYLLLLRPIPGQEPFMVILVTMGLSLILIDAAQLIFGADYHQINIPLQSRNLHMGTHIAINATWLVSFGIAIVLGSGMYWFVIHTMFGRAARAVAQNSYSAPLMGINVNRVQAIAFGMGAAAAAMAGGLLLPVLYVFPEVGNQYQLKSFVMVVLGGMGSIQGAALAGLVLGVVESLTSYYWGNEWALAVDFVIFILVLSFRPSGIFGSQRA